MNQQEQTCVLTINAGSSSLKFSVYQQQDVLMVGQFDRVKTPECWVKIKGNTGELLVDMAIGEGTAVSHANCLKWIINYLEAADLQISAVGHRVVHGGLKYKESVLITRDVLAELEELESLAPLHQPHNLAGIRACGAHLPDVPQVACFDTAFHQHRPMIDRLYGIKKEIVESDGIMAYGFHGLSYTHIANELSQMQSPPKRAAVCHLGNGSSVCGLLDGKGITSSMGFTALDGLMMGTRSGSIDAGAVLYLVEKYGYDETFSLLYKQGGLLGVSGISSDVRNLQEAARNGSSDAERALQKFSWMVAKEICHMLPNLGGLDAVIFTAGIGEKSSLIRSQVCQALAWMGLELDDEKNNTNSRMISTPESKIKAYVIPTDEEGVIARDTLNLAFA